MGKGNVKSFKGKLFNGSFGKYRLRKKKKKIATLPSKPAIVEALATSTPIECFQKGDIVKGEKIKHPVIYLGLDRSDSSNFYGCFITHSVGYEINASMNERHFCKQDERGNKYCVQYDASYVCRCLLVKKRDWGPYKKKGQLTAEGLQFIEDAIRGKEPVAWQDYYFG